MGMVADQFEQAWCEGQETLELDDEPFGVEPEPEACSDCLGTCICQSCGGSGKGEEQRRAENAELMRAHQARYALEAKVANWAEVVRSTAPGVAAEMVQEVGSW